MHYDPGTYQELLKVPQGVPVTKLHISLKSQQALAAAGAPEKHVPSAKLPLIDLRLKRAHPDEGQQESYQTAENRAAAEPGAAEKAVGAQRPCLRCLRSAAGLPGRAAKSTSKASPLTNIVGNWEPSKVNTETTFRDTSPSGPLTMSI